MGAEAGPPLFLERVPEKTDTPSHSGHLQSLAGSHAESSRSLPGTRSSLPRLPDLCLAIVVESFPKFTRTVSLVLPPEPHRTSPLPLDVGMWGTRPLWVRPSPEEQGPHLSFSSSSLDKAAVLESRGWFRSL